MTKTRQDKTIGTDAVELEDAALDRAAGGGGLLFNPLPSPVRLTSNDGTGTSVKDGTSNTLVGIDYRP